MNEHDFPLHRLLDEAASAFHPVADVGRLERALTPRPRRRGVVLFSSAAACFALIGGTALAFRDDGSSAKLAPGQETEVPDRRKPDVGEPSVTEPKTTEPKTTEPKTTEPTPTDPPATEPKVTEPATTEVKVVEPVASEPKTTEPKTTQPKTTEPKSTEPTTTEPKPTDPPVTEPKGETSEWSAFQVYGACEDDPPFDVFYGTASPGATISITSEYGSGSTTAGEAGEWEVRVYFPTAPFGEKIKVWVSSGDHLDDFWFKRLG